MQVEILSPNKEIFKGESEAITLPGQLGQFQVLRNHANLFSVLKQGKVIIQKKDEVVKEIKILSGIAKVSNNKVTVLVKESKCRN